MIRRLAVGGMGEIFLARQAIAGVDRLVVVKRLLPGLSENAELVAMFIDEARIAASLTHPGIVQVHEFGEDAEGSFIVMELVAGHHVGQLIARAQRDGKQVAIRIGAFIVNEIARALDHAHHARDSDGTPLEIVHRDISPSNVLVSFRGDVKLMDFGVARAANRSHRTNDGSIRGKFAYMAPEQIEAKDVDARSDVFAAGILLWELTLGRRLFTGPSDLETLRATLEQPIPRPTSIDPDYPPALEAIVMSALERDRGRRLASAAELAAGLKAYLRSDPTDRDELAALMVELFPDDAADSERLDDPPTAEDVARPTVLLPGGGAAAAQRGDAPAMIAPVTAPRSRWRRRLVAMLALGVGGGVLAMVLQVQSPGVSSTPGASAAADVAKPVMLGSGSGSTPAPPAGSGLPADAAHGLRADVPPVIATASGSRPDVKRSRRVPRRGPPDSPHVDAPANVAREAASAAPRVALPPAPEAAPEAAIGELALSASPGIAIRVDGPAACTLHSVPMRCHLPVGQAYEFGFRVPGGVAFKATLRAGMPLRKYAVDPAREAVDCVDNC